MDYVVSTWAMTKGIDQEKVGLSLPQLLQLVTTKTNPIKTAVILCLELLGEPRKYTKHKKKFDFDRVVIMHLVFKKGLQMYVIQKSNPKTD